jgi:predicted nucleic acid-binding protein
LTVYYFDTSALVKRYAEEAGTAWVLETTNPNAGQDIYIVRITAPEMIAALFRKIRTGEATQEVASRAAESFKNDFRSQYQILDVNEDIVERAMTMAQRHGLRGYDAVQLAAAYELYVVHNETGSNLPTFISADNDLDQAAESEGLEVDNPNAHA